ncbi:MAG: DNA-processing protein DprA, partial [Oscillospiraceae bacterium]|nr:DNA-processing protein DprA [Oscillospiraceae bacterium]
MNEKTVYWIWLTNALGYNNPKLKRIYELYKDIEKFYTGGEREWRFSGLFSDKELDALNKSQLADAKNIISKSINLGYSVLTIDDEIYPKCLYNIYAPPAVLYISGELPDVDNRMTIAIVGARRPKEYGIRHAYNI